MSVRFPTDDANRIAREAAHHNLSVNAYIHRTVMAEINKEAERFAAPTRRFLDDIQADPEARARFAALDARIDPKPLHADQDAA